LARKIPPAAENTRLRAMIRNIEVEAAFRNITTPQQKENITLPLLQAEGQRQVIE
jgi:hypothetical protein